MKNMKKMIATATAAITVLTNVISASALTTASGNQVKFPLEAYVGQSIPAGDYYSANASNVKYTVALGSGGTVKLNEGGIASNGKRSLQLKGNDKDVGGSTGGAKISFKLGATEKTADQKYVISFDAWRQSANWQDYAALNEGKWNGDSRLTDTKTWTKQTLGVGSEIGGIGDKEWTRYTATQSTIYSPQIDFSVYGWGAIHIDNIVIKDTSGNVIYSEDFEGDVVELKEGVHEITTGNDGWVFTGSSSDVAIELKDEADGTGKRLRVLGKSGKSNVCTYKIPLPAKAEDGVYYITCDYTKTSDGASDGSTSIDLVGNNIYGAGCINKIKSNGQLVVSGSGDYLYIAGTGWCGVYIDNIVVKDKNGKVLFTEDFDNYDEKYSYKTYETKLHGLAGNGRDGVIYLSWRNPVRNDIAAIQIYENDEETISGQLADISLESSHVNIVEMTDEIYSGDGSIHTYDVRMITTSNEVFHNYVTAKEGTPFIFRTNAEDGTPLQGWTINYADGSEVLALGKVEYDTLNKAEGNTSLHINPNITYTSMNQPEGTEKTTVRASYSDGARMNLDTQLGGLEAGATYKLTWKQKGHRISHYYVQLVMDDKAETIGDMTANSAYVTTPWQNRELEFTVDNVGAMPTLRFEFSNGANDFWLDDMQLVKVGTTENLIANGSFEYGMKDLKANGNNVTWTLADKTDSVNVYIKAGDTLVEVDSLPAGTESYTADTFEGTNATYVFKTVKKSGNTEYRSEEYSVEISRSSYIYDAVVEVVELQDDEYVVVDTATALTSNTMVKASVKIENAAEETAVAADVFTALYKDGKLIAADLNTPSAVKGGEMESGSVISIPALDDGEYMLKVFVWNEGEMKPIKNVKVLNEITE